MPTYKLLIAYDGSGFHGYARQPNVRTVQGELEAALFRLIGEVETSVAGRTDKGVHAVGQVVSFSTGEILDTRTLRSLNRQLAPEISVLALGYAPEGFSARFSATERAYIYRIAENVARNLVAGHLKWQKSRNREQPLPDKLGELHPDPRPVDSALNEVEEKQEGICLALREVLGLLPDVQREVLVAYGLAGDFEVSAAELGVDLGHKFNNGVPIPAGTIRQYKRRAKRKIDTEMRKRGYDLGVVRN